jgi:hypothetical protein
VTRRGILREAARVAIIVILVVTVMLATRNTDLLRDQRDGAAAAAKTNGESVNKVGEALADVCKAAPAKSIKATGRTRDCQLAKQGKIKELVPVIQPTPPPAKVVVSQADIEKAVDAYLGNYLTDLSVTYRAQMRRAVIDYLTANPPAPGPQGKPGPPPSTAVVAGVVVDYLQKNPPKAGPAGDAGATGPSGVSVVGAALDGCDVVFTFSNDTTTRVGPVCGKDGRDGEKGPGPTAAELRAAWDSYCADQPGGTCEGPRGPAGYPEGWQNSNGETCTDPDGDHFYTCVVGTPPPTSPPPSARLPLLPTG